MREPARADQLRGQRRMGKRRKRRTPSPSGHRPPSPARAAVSNANIVIAGEGRGWGNIELSSGRWRKNAINHTPQTPADGLNLEYGASAVFPCGQSQRSIRTATLPH